MPCTAKRCSAWSVAGSTTDVAFRCPKLACSIARWAGDSGGGPTGERSSGRAPCRLIASEGKKLLLRGFRLQREELVCLSQAEAEEAVGHIDASPQPATSTGSCHSNACSWRLRHILWVASSRPGAREAGEAAASCF